MSTPPPAPGHDVFPVHSRADVDTNGKVTGIVTQLDLTELSEALAPRLADPDSEFTSSEVVPRPDPANQTKGPHRYTIYVPYDDGSNINVGAGKGKFSNGISMVTKSTVVMSAYSGAPTFLSLGLPSTALGVGAENNSGYCMYTEASSNHTSKLQMALVSQDDGIGLTAKKDIILHSNTGNVSVEATEGATLKGKKVTINATSGEVINAPWYDQAAAVVLTVVDAADFAAPLAGHKGGDTEASVNTGTAAMNFLGGFVNKNAAKLKDQWIAAASEHVNYFLTHVATISGLILSFKKTWKEPKKGSSAWEVKTAKWSYVVSVASELMALYKDYPKAADPADPGSVSIDAESTIGISAKGGITINGAGGVGLTGFKGVSLGGLTASMKGHKEATIFGGLGASMKSLAGDVAMSSDLKGATVKGKKDVEMSSEAGKATFTGNLDTQLNSVTAKTFVHGKTHVLLGTSKFGVVAHERSATIGKLKGGEEFSSLAVDESFAEFSDQGVTVKCTDDNAVDWNKSGIVVQAKALDVKVTGKITIKGSNIDIG